MDRETTDLALGENQPDGGARPLQSDRVEEITEIDRERIVISTFSFDMLVVKATISESHSPFSQ